MGVMKKIIRIEYPNGEMNIDLLPFIAKHNINDIRFLAKKVIAISPYRHKIKQEILETINEIRDSENWQMYNKRLDRLTEFLDRYVKD